MSNYNYHPTKINYDEIVDFYLKNENTTIKEIASIYNVHRASIERILKRRGVKTRQHWEQKTYKIKGKEQEIINSYLNENFTIQKLAKDYETCDKTIRDILKKNNIKIKSVSYHRAKFINSKKDEIIDLFVNKNLSMNKIAKLYNTSAIPIARILKENNIKRKSSMFYTEQTRSSNQNEVINLYLGQDKSINQIRKILNISATQIRRILTDNDISTSIYQFRRKYKINEDYFEIIDSHEKAYWLGVLWTDGYLYEKGYAIKIDLQARDIKLLENFRACLNAESPIVHWEREKDGKIFKYVSFIIHSKKMATDLKNKGMHQNKSLTIEYPIIDKKYFFSFLCGAFMGDGCFCLTKVKGRVKFTISLISASEKFIKAVQESLINVKYPLNFRKQWNKEYTRYYYSLYTGHRIYAVKFIEKLFENIGCNVYLQRKFNKYLKAKESLVSDPVHIECIRNNKIS